MGFYTLKIPIKFVYIEIMKKLIVTSAILALVSMGITSCKSHEKCPAYSKVTVKHNKASV